MKTNFDKIILVFTILAITSFLHYSSSADTVSAQANNSGSGNNQPNINAQSLFNTKTMVTGKQCKEPCDTHT